MDLLCRSYQKAPVVDVSGGPSVLVRGVVMVWRHPVSPRVRVSMHVHNGDHQQRIIDNAVNYAIGKAAQPATSRSLRQERPGVGEFGDAVQCVLHLDRQLVPEPFALLVVIAPRPSGEIRPSFAGRLLNSTEHPFGRQRLDVSPFVRP